MLDLDNTTMKNGWLTTKKDDGSILSICEETASVDELKLFDEFRAAFPNGKSDPILEPIPTIEEKLAATQQELEETQNKLIETRASLENINSDVQNFMDYVISTMPS